MSQYKETRIILKAWLERMMRDSTALELGFNPLNAAQRGIEIRRRAGLLQRALDGVTPQRLEELSSEVMKVAEKTTNKKTTMKKGEQKAAAEKKAAKKPKPRTVSDAVQEHMARINEDPFAQSDVDRDQSIDFYESLATECQEWVDQLKMDAEDEDEEDAKEREDGEEDEDEEDDDEE